MTLQELIETLSSRYDTQLSQKLTHFGSEYIRVKGLTFRISDHTSKWQMSDHIDVSSYDDILNYLLDGELINETSISKDELIGLYLSGLTYKGIKISQTDKGYYDNGYGQFVDLKSAANNLYYNVVR